MAVSNLRPDSAASVSSDPPIMAVARRYWWVSALILLLVTLVAGGRYLTAPQIYVATQNLSVALIPAQALDDAGDAALAMSGARAVAHAIASSDVVATPTFADAVLTRLPADTTRRESVTKAGIQKALSATDQEAQVRVEARWPTAAGARAIVSAAAPGAPGESTHTRLCAESWRYRLGTAGVVRACGGTRSSTTGG